MDREAQQNELDELGILFVTTSVSEGKILTKPPVLLNLVDMINERLSIVNTVIDPITETRVGLQLDFSTEKSCSPVNYIVSTISDDGTPHIVAQFSPHNSNDYHNMLLMLRDYFRFPLDIFA